jgi:hypothetical protein
MESRLKTSWSVLFREIFVVFVVENHTKHINGLWGGGQNVWFINVKDDGIYDDHVSGININTNRSGYYPKY